MTSADLLVEGFGLPLDPLDTGYGHRADEVAAVRASEELLLGYHAAVPQQPIGYVEGLGDADLGRIVDEAWDPPVTLGVRLVSVIGDDLQHAGQAAFVRGVARRGELRLRSRRCPRRCAVTAAPGTSARWAAPWCSPCRRGSGGPGRPPGWP